MDIGVIGYPQVLLGLWGPLALRVAWFVWTRRSAGSVAPATRSLVTAAVAVAPLVALFVPFDPSTPLRDALPWHAPLAWGIALAPPVGAERSPIGLVLTLFAVVPVVSVLVSFSIGVVEVMVSRCRLARLVTGRRGDLRLIAEKDCLTACVAGLFVPRVYITESALGESHASAVIAHERSHQRRLHPLLKWTVGCALRAWWWIPGARAMRRDLVVSTELWADDAARRSVGDRAVASALLGSIQQTGVGGLRTAVSVAGLVGSESVLEVRVAALCMPVRPRGSVQRFLVPALLLGSLVLFVLLF
ncbi:M56 family metallopeptidase [Microbacterium sp. M1A1_1b]